MTAAAGRSWLHALAEHPVFRDEGAFAADTARRSDKLAVRGTDLIAVVQNEIRLTNLAQAKRQLSDTGADALAYKVLTHELLDFPITGIVVNPTGKLLAVFGTHEVAMVILPRKGYLQHVGTACAVKAMRIGAYYHAPHGGAAIAQCAWHPLGRDGASLLVLTEDARLREYDVLRDLDEPQQTLACTPDANRGHTAFSAEDEEASRAVAFALGASESTPPTCDEEAPYVSWLVLGMLVLMQNGDVYALCPFLPKRAAVPRAAIQALARAPPPNELARRYMADLVRQLAADRPADTSWDDTLHEHGVAHVQAPAAVTHRLAPQGPFLQRPAPEERSEEMAPLASDLLLTRIPAPQGRQVAPLDVVGIGTRDGSVQLCLLAAPMRPAWVQRTPPEPAPTLAVYETVVLPLEVPGQSYTDLQAANQLRLVQDPLYPDTMCVTHLRGVHRIAMRWAEPLLEAIAAGPSQVQDMLRTGLSSEVVCLAHARETGAAHMVGAVLVNDVYLSYALLALTVDTQLVSLEFDLRTAAPTPADAPQERKTYASLLAQDPFTPPTFATAAPHRSAPHTPLDVSATSLRAFGTAAEQVRTRIRDVVTDANRTQGRLERQVQEAQRQIEQLTDVKRRVAALDARAVEARLARIEAAQRASLARTDALLQHLMDEHQPQLSVHERRWLDELQRMAREFGVGATPRAPAREQLQKLAHQLAVLRPSLPQYAARQHAAAPHGQRLGTAQTQRVETLLAHEAELLAQARAKIQWMQQALASR